MKYYKKCDDCKGQGNRVSHRGAISLSTSCHCEGGFVDCTEDVLAMQKANGIMRDRLEYIRAIASDSARDGILSESDLRARLLHISERAAKALLATIAKDESMKSDVE